MPHVLVRPQDHSESGEDTRLAPRRPCAVSGLKSRPNIKSCLTSGHAGRAWMVSTQAPLPNYSTGSGPFFPRGPGAVSVYLYTVDFRSLPACRSVQTSQPHPPAGTRGHPHPDTSEPASHRPGCLLCSRVHLPYAQRGTAHSVLTAGLCICVTDKPQPISPARCCMSCVQPSHHPRVAAPPHQWGEQQAVRHPRSNTG